MMASSEAQDFLLRVHALTPDQKRQLAKLYRAEADTRSKDGAVFRKLAEAVERMADREEAQS
jgi:hypothetical protein